MDWPEPPTCACDRACVPLLPDTPLPCEPCLGRTGMEITIGNQDLPLVFGQVKDTPTSPGTPRRRDRARRGAERGLPWPGLPGAELTPVGPKLHAQQRPPSRAGTSSPGLPSLPADPAGPPPRTGHLPCGRVLRAADSLAQRPPGFPRRARSAASPAASPPSTCCSPPFTIVIIIVSLG